MFDYVFVVYIEKSTFVAVMVVKLNGSGLADFDISGQKLTYMGRRRQSEGSFCLCDADFNREYGRVLESEHRFIGNIIANAENPAVTAF